MATVQQYKLGWPAGEDEMLLVSIDGTASNAKIRIHSRKMNIIYNASSPCRPPMYAASNEQDSCFAAFENA